MRINPYKMEARRAILDFFILDRPVCWIAHQMFGRWCIVIFAILGSVSALSCPPANFTTPFEINANFNLTAFISARWCAPPYAAELICGC